MVSGPLPRLALVPGEPAGVGPELCVRLAQRVRDYTLTAFADANALREAAARLGLPLELVAPRSAGAGSRPGTLAFIDTPHAHPAQPGVPDPANAASVVLALHAAADACQRGEMDGMVTGPVHKATINLGGIAYTGTTELLADHSACDVVMMLANATARVALATTHLPLREVADAIADAPLERTLRILHRALQRDFGLPAPTIAVLGLNPHAGEAGHLGSEEADVIEPVLDRLRATGMALVGPLPADTAFLPAKLRGFAAVLAMYHDQGLPVLKFSGFEEAVNVTLGLPYPRVAVDHGTALDLAGRGTADPSSLYAAADTCARIVHARAAFDRAAAG
ncbi:4-hydroxythreonine-4-phosphate dehydrogenase PdxA [Lysobacter sp. A3-1-A15]|uniref:4-hydroxythreonine-4-phosphate dehydrogenase PdxA n=1 Tax=Novilysobacter viscosus TaxID=3098602 RepID=UPI002EDACD13